MECVDMVWSVTWVLGVVSLEEKAEIGSNFFVKSRCTLEGEKCGMVKLRVFSKLWNGWISTGLWKFFLYKEVCNMHELVVVELFFFSLHQEDIL